MAAKTSRKPKRKAPKYHRLTREQRIIIETLRKEGYSIRPIAVRLGVSPATVSRELRRNRSKKGYRNRKADGAPFGGRLRPPSRTGAPCGAPRTPCAPPVALRPALRATCRASTRRKNGLSGEPGGATMPPIHTEAPAWAGYAAGVALASCCRERGTMFRVA